MIQRSRSPPIKQKDMQFKNPRALSNVGSNDQVTKSSQYPANAFASELNQKKGKSRNSFMKNSSQQTYQPSMSLQGSINLNSRNVSP